jgi:hypothetical protein
MYSLQSGKALADMVAQHARIASKDCAQGWYVSVPLAQLKRGDRSFFLGVSLVSSRIEINSNGRGAKYAQAVKMWWLHF